MPAALLAVLLLLVLPACSGGDDRGSGEAGPPGTPLRVGEVPSLVVGEAQGDPDHELFRVRSPFLLPDGRLAVPLAGEGTVRIFGPDGRLVERLGGAGEGPGEFRSLGEAWARGDTIEAFDGGLRRITRFLPDGSVEAVLLDPVATAQTALPDPLSDGWVVSGVASARMNGRDEVVLHHFAPDGSHRGEIARVGGFTRYAFPGGGGGPEPLSPRAVLGVHGDEVYLAETLTPRIEVRDAAGTPLREIAWQPAGAPSPARVLQTVVEAAAERGDAPGFAAPHLLEAAAVPERVSVFWDLLVDEEGFLWVRPFEPLQHAAALGGLARGAGPGGEWEILSPEGEGVGRVRMPAGFQPARIGSEEVVGIYRDAMDVESVRVYPLRRR